MRWLTPNERPIQTHLNETRLLNVSIVLMMAFNVSQNKIEERLKTDNIYSFIKVDLMCFSDAMTVFWDWCIANTFKFAILACMFN